MENVFRVRLKEDFWELQKHNAFMKWQKGESFDQSWMVCITALLDLHHREREGLINDESFPCLLHKGHWEQTCACVVCISIFLYFAFVHLNRCIIMSSE